MKIIQISLVPAFAILLVLSALRVYNPAEEIHKASRISTDRIKGMETYKEEIEYFEKWNYPYGQNIPKDVYNRMWKEVQSTPSEKDMNSPVINSWQKIGPYGMKDNNSTAKYTGRILDVDIYNTSSIRVATATGGLWGYFGPFPLSLSDDINCLAVGSFDTHPTDNNTILLGTGEYYTGSPSYQKTGTGLWKTTDGGNSWNHINMSPQPDGFSRIRYSKQNPNIVHAVTVDGYYRSTNSGNNWTRTLSNSFCYDMAIDPVNNNNVYITCRSKMFKSTNAGLNFTQIGTFNSGFPTLNVGRISITVCPSSPNILYTGVELDSTDEMLGVFKSDNGGLGWWEVSPSANVLGGQGNYDNVIAASPTNSNIVLFGGIRMWRTSNGGSNWIQIEDEDIHADQHAIEWKNSNEVYVGNDGGLCYSTDAGLTWQSNTNLFPVTQFVSLSVGVSDPTVMFGGSRDNGVSRTTDGGLTWHKSITGDGGGVAIDPFYAANVYAVNGVYNGSWAFKRFKSTNYGVDFTELSNASIDPSRNTYMKIRTDRTVPIKIYTNSGPFIYRSTNAGTNFAKLTADSLPCSSITDFTVSNTNGYVYVCLFNSPVTANRVRVYENGSWYERSSGLPAGQNVRTIQVHKTDPNTAYALMNGLGNPGQKIYKTTNRGISWTNISGNIPDIPMGDIVPNPNNSNLLYLGTQLGAYRSSNGGSNWHRWNNGIPDATVITEMGFIDSTNTSGKFFVVAATYGRSMIMRDVSGDDPNGITPISGNIPRKYSLEQNFPNPFNPVTNIKFSIPSAGEVKLVVYDITGKAAGVLINAKLNAGTYNYDFDASHLASGVYFYRITSGSFTDVKKMILVK